MSITSFLFSLKKRRRFLRRVVLFVLVVYLIADFVGLVEPLPVFTKMEQMETLHIIRKSFPLGAMWTVFQSPEEIGGGSNIAGNVSLYDSIVSDGIPTLYILTSAQYSVFKDRSGYTPALILPSDFVTETSLRNYTYFGATRTVVLTFNVFGRETSAYHFLVLGATTHNVTLYLKVTAPPRIIHPYEIYFSVFKWIAFVLAAVFFVWEIREKITDRIP